MDDLMLVRSGIFLVGGLVSIIFRKQLNNLKNRLFTKLDLKKWVRDESKGYIIAGMIFIIISIILFIFSTTM